MADATIRQVIHTMGLDAADYQRGAQQIDQANQKIVQSTARTVEAEERVTASTRTVADGFARLEARYDPLIRAEQRRQAALAQANRYLAEGAVANDRYVASVGRINAFYDQQVTQINRLRGVNDNAVAGAQRFRGAIQQAGFQVGDFATQVASGGNAVVAFTQQSGQLLGVFGMWGAVVGAAVTILGAIAIKLFDVGQSTKDAETATRDLEKAQATLNGVMLAAADAAKIKETADRAEAAGILQKAQALKEEAAAHAAVRVAAGDDLEASGNRGRGRIRAALNESLGTGERAAGADPLGKLKADLFTANEDARELQEKIDALNSGVNLQDIFKKGDAFRDYREQLELQVKLSAMETEEAKIQGELARARKDYNLEIGSALDRQIESLLRQRAANEQIKKQDEERLKFTTRIVDMLDQEARRAQEAAAKRNAAVEKYIAGLEDAAAAEELSGVEKKVQLATLEAQNKLLDEQGAKLRDLTEEERRRIEIAVRTKDQLEEQRKAYDKLTKDIERATDRMLDRIADAAGDILFDYMEGRAGNFWETFERLGKRALADLAAEQLTQTFLRPVVSGLVSAVPSLFGISLPSGGAAGGVPGAGGGSPVGVGSAFGLGNLVASAGIGVPQFLKDIIWDVFGGIGETGSFAVDLINGIGASPWGIIGGLGANLLGLGSKNPIVDFASGTLGAIAGGAIGSSIGGTLLGIGAGPLGAIAGAFLGTALGGLFGGGKPAFSGGQINLAADAQGRLIQTEAGFKNFGDTEGAKSYTQEFIDGVNQAFAAVGLSFAGGGNFASVGFGQESQSIDFTVKQLITSGRIRSGSDRLDAMIKGIDLSGGAQDLLTRATDLAAVFKTIESVNAPVNQTVDALKAVNDQFDRMAVLARQYGLDASALETARQNQLGAIRNAIAAPYYQAAGGIADFLNAQALSSTSSLGPTDRLAEAQRQFGDVLTRVRGGEVGLTGALTQSGGTLLGIGRDLYGSTAQGAAMERWVRESLLSVAELFTSDAFVDAQIAAIGQQTQVTQDGFDRLVDEVKRLRAEVSRLAQIQQAA